MSFKSRARKRFKRRAEQKRRQVSREVDAVLREHQKTAPFDPRCDAVQTPERQSIDYPLTSESQQPDSVPPWSLRCRVESSLAIPNFN